MQAGPTPQDLEQEPKPKTTGKTRPAGPQKINQPKSGPAPRAASRRKPTLADDLGEVLVIANLFAAPFLKEDVLDDQEILALASAMEAQAAKSPRFKRILDRAMGVTGTSGLIGVVIMIAGRRAARHGIIERGWDFRLSAIMRLQNAGIDPSDPTQLEAAAAVMQQAAEEAVQAQTPEQEPTQNGYPEAGFGSPISVRPTF